MRCGLPGDCKVNRKNFCVVQGCVFSPLLFSILMPDIANKLQTFVKQIEKRYSKVSLAFHLFIDELVLSAVTTPATIEGWTSRGAQPERLTSALIEKHCKFLSEHGLESAKELNIKSFLEENISHTAQ